MHTSSQPTATTISAAPSVVAISNNQQPPTARSTSVANQHSTSSLHHRSSSAPPLPRSTSSSKHQVYTSRSRSSSHHKQPLLLCSRPRTRKSSSRGSASSPRSSSSRARARFLHHLATRPARTTPRPCSSPRAAAEAVHQTIAGDRLRYSELARGKNWHFSGRHSTHTLDSSSSVIHCLERSAYASVLRVFYAQSDLSWARLLTNLRNELRLSYMEHREVIARVSSNEYIKSLRKFSLVNYSGLVKKTPAFDLHAVVPDKIDKTGQSFTSLVPQSPTPAHMMSPARNIGILGISSSTTKGSCFDPDATVPAKKLKSGSGSALAYFKCPPCAERLPEAVSSVRAESPKHDLLDNSKKSPCAMKAGCAVSPMFQEKHNQSNAGDVPWCVHKDMEVPRKRGTEVSPVSRSKGLSVITYSAGNIDHDSDNDIIKILLTCGLVNKVEELFKVKPDPTSLQTAKLILKDQESHLLDALVKLSEVSSASEVNQHDEVKGDPVSYDEAPTSSITELRRAETEGETQGAQGRRELEPAVKRARRTTVRLSGAEWVECLPRKRKKREGCVLHYSAPCLV